LSDAPPPATAPLVSAIVPAYNAASTLAACLAALLASDYSALEVIVVDDGSTDGTVEVASRPGVRVVRQPNRGAAAARNAGAAVARGEHFYFLDADVVVEPDTVRRLVHTVRDHGVDLAVGRYSTRPINAGIGAHYKALVDYVLYVPPDRRGRVYLDGQIGGGGDFVSRRAFEALGGYDARMPGAGVEREEFYIRFYEAGFHSAADPTIATRHSFPPLRKLPGLYNSRIHGTMRLLSDRRPPFTYIRRGTLLAGVLGATALLVALVATLFAAPWWLLPAGVGVFVAANADFFREAWRRKGPLRAAAFVPIHAGILMIIGGAAAVSFVRVAVSKRRARGPS
jgi:glycosyltransferase involved in cell wall biosynthesis